MPLVCVLALAGAIAWAADLQLARWAIPEPDPGPRLVVPISPAAANGVTYFAVDGQRMLISVSCSPEVASSLIEINPEELPSVVADVCRHTAD
jgi:hypothetical protein